MPEFGQSEAWLRLQLRLYRRLNRKQSTGAYSPRFVFVLCPFAPGSRVNRNLGWPPQLDGKRALRRTACVPVPTSALRVLTIRFDWPKAKERLIQFREKGGPPIVLDTGFVAAVLEWIEAPLSELIERVETAELQSSLDVLQSRVTAL